MSLLKDFLRKVHIIGDTGPLDESKAPPQAGAKKPVIEKKRIISFEELREQSKKIKRGQFEELVPAGEELKLTFDDILERANVKEPKHGWTIMKIVERLATSEYQKMSNEQVKTALMGDLKADRAKPEEVLQDAVHRDEILDDYEVFLSKRVADTAVKLRDENFEILKKIKELSEKRESNEKRISDEELALTAWKKQKLEIEKKMASAASYFTVENVVSVGGVSEAAHKEESHEQPARVKEARPVKKSEPKRAEEKSTETAPLDEGSPEVPQLLNTDDFKF